MPKDVHGNNHTGLVLQRKKNECIRIGHDITITVVDFRDKGKVRLLIEAPRDVPVNREEVYQAILRGDGQFKSNKRGK